MWKVYPVWTESETLRSLRPTTEHETCSGKLIAIGPEADIENAILKIRKALKEQDGAFIQFFELAKLTGAPQKVSGGYYVGLAKQMHYSRQTALLDQGTKISRMAATAEQRAKHNHRCKDHNGCSSVGLLPDGTFCSCSIGQFAATLANQAGRGVSSAAA